MEVLERCNERGLKMERAIDKARSPDILMIPIPPRPKGVAIAAIVDPFMYKNDECGMMNVE